MCRAGLTLSALLAAAPAAFAQAPTAPPAPGSPGNPRVPTPGAGAPAGAQPGGVPGALTAATAVSPQLDAHLKAWQAKSQGLQNLYAECEVVRKDVLRRTQKTFDGKVICMKPNLARMRLDNKANPADWLAYICDGATVYQYEGLEKTVTHVKVPPGGQGGVGDNVLLEFMSGVMTADDVKRRFDLALVKEEEFYVHLEIKPRLDKDREEFEKVLLVLYGPKAAPHKRDYLPAVVVMTKPNGQEVEQWTFKTVAANANGIKKEDFVYVPPQQGWKVEAAKTAPPGAAGPRVARPAPPGGGKP